jgi:hypothetical protein
MYTLIYIKHPISNIKLKCMIHFLYIVNPYKEFRIICVGIMSVPWIGPTGMAMSTPTYYAIS